MHHVDSEKEEATFKSLLINGIFTNFEANLKL